jgi:hypothetical protein
VLEYVDPAPGRAEVLVLLNAGLKPDETFDGGGRAGSEECDDEEGWLLFAEFEIPGGGGYDMMNDCLYSARTFATYL